MNDLGDSIQLREVNDDKKQIENVDLSIPIGRIARNKSQRMKKMQSDEDILYECLINKLKK